MQQYGHLLLTITLPILIVCLCGAVIQQKRPIQSKTLADVSLYVLSPALILTALTESNITGSDVMHVLWFTIIMTVLSWVIGTVVGKLAQFPAQTAQALVLTTLFSNCNNYGLPLLLMAFGKSGFTLGSTYVVGQIISVNVLGMYIASRSNGNAKQALLQVAKSPLIYAAFVGAVLYILGLRLPNGIDSAAKLLGDAYPAIVLLILGVQLRKTNLRGLKRKDIWIGVVLRILVIPLLAKLVIFILGIHGLLASVLFIEISMPAAINTIVLVERYDGDSQFVSLVVSVTTLLSFLYLPLLIALS